MLREYFAEPTPALFHADDSFVRGIMGPIGSGKSVACVIEIISRAMRQRPNSDGARRTRWAVIRNTYPELTSTTIKTWMDWLPVSQCPIVYSAPITGKFNAPISDGTRIECEVLFLALDRPQDIKKLLSLELTGAWINEAREMEKLIIDTVTSRVGRFPSKIDGGPSWSGVILDTNPPDDDHWWYQLAEEYRPQNWKFWRQPGALIDRGNGDYIINASAENLENQPLGADYWLRQIGGKTKEWIRVYLMGQYGTVMSGKPIYAGSWSDSLHVADVKSLIRHEIICGWDWGLTPACVIAQVTPRGRIIVTDEVIGEDTGVRQFAENAVIPLLQTKYRDCPQTHIGDPAGNQRSQADEKTVFEELRLLGIHCRSAPNNSPLARWEAVRYYLGRMIDGKPAFALSPACKVLRKGFNGGYKFRQMQVSGEARYSEQADKNRFSHPHDALGYLALHLREPSKRPAQRVVTNEFPVFDTVAGY